MEFADPMDRQASNQSISKSARAVGLLGRLARDRKGNTIALIAASTAPLLALIGGGIDMSRGYLAQTRLTPACLPRARSWAPRSSSMARCPMP
jgi:Flp pilus assembly protein TadG